MGEAYLPRGQTEGTGDSYSTRHHVLLLEVVSYTLTELHTYKKKIQQANAPFIVQEERRKLLICKDLQLLSLENFWNIQ